MFTVTVADFHTCCPSSERHKGKSVQFIKKQHTASSVITRCTFCPNMLTLNLQCTRPTTIQLKTFSQLHTMLTSCCVMSHDNHVNGTQTKPPLTPAPHRRMQHLSKEQLDVTHTSWLAIHTQGKGYISVDGRAQLLTTHSKRFSIPIYQLQTLLSS